MNFFNALRFKFVATGIILSGGRSSRFRDGGGFAKPFLRFGSKFLIELVVEKLKQVCCEPVILSINRRQADRFKFLNLQLAYDIYPDKGPLSGLHGGLCASKDWHNLIVSCDLPFLQVPLLRYLIECAEAGNYDVVVCCLTAHLLKTSSKVLPNSIPVVAKLSDGIIQPLLGVYSKACIQPIEESLCSQNLRVASFYGAVKVKYITEDEILNYDPKLLSFFNINDWEAYERALKIISDVCDANR